MATTIEYNIKVNDQGATKTLGQMEEELAAINEELKGVEVGSDAFKALSKQSQALTKDLDKANLAIQGVTDEDKIRGFQGAIDIAAGSVSALTGAVGLLGLESEEFEKYTAYAANAIAFSEGLRAAAQGAVDLRQFLKVAGVQATIFGNVTKKALISTGIGALVVALGTIIAYWEEITDLISGADEAQKRYNDKLNTQLKESEGIVGVLESEIKLLESKDQSTLETNKKLLSQLALQIDITNQLLAQAQLELQTEEEENRQITFWEKIKLGIFGATGAYGAFATTLADSVNPASEKTAELQEKINELQIKSNGLQAQYAEVSGTVAIQEEMRAGATQKVEAITRGLSDSVTNLNLESQIVGATIDDNTAAYIRQKNAKEIDILTTKAQESEEARYREGLFESANAITNLSNVLGQESAAGKALAISTAIINTYLGVTEALKQKSTLPSPFDVITKVANVATILASGFKAVRAIKSTPAGPNARGASNMSSIGGAAPAITQPSAAAIPIGVTAEEVAATQGPVRAYVLTGDVTSGAEAQAKLNTRRTLD